MGSHLLVIHHRNFSGAEQKYLSQAIALHSARSIRHFGVSCLMVQTSADGYDDEDQCCITAFQFSQMLQVHIWKCHRLSRIIRLGLSLIPRLQFCSEAMPINVVTLCVLENAQGNAILGWQSIFSTSEFRLLIQPIYQQLQPKLVRCYNISMLYIAI